MRKWTLFVLSLLSASAAHAQTAVQYHLAYPAAESRVVQVRIELSLPRPAPLTLIMPRNYPGGYGLVFYDSFVEDVRAFSDQGQLLTVKRVPDGPRWSLGAVGEQIVRVEYSVDLVRMEKEIRDAVDSSKVRPRYVGLLGYSVFAYIDGLEDTNIGLQVDGPPDWPVFSTITPAVPAALHSVSVSSPNYYTLADSEVLMGPDLQLRRFDGAITLVMAVYAEGEEDLALESDIARTALDRVQRYFGDAPFPAYTVQREVLKPLPRHEYDFAQEHLNSGTFVSSIDEATTTRTTPGQRESQLTHYAHHMAHSWVPKRAYGEGYMPILWEMPPVIDTIWFNEGFGRYAGIAALADGMTKQEGEEFRRRQIARLKSIVDNAPGFIRRMPTVVLSREASFLYAQDFRTGMNTFARGALMAAEMDDRIRLRSQGKESLRDALRAIVLRVQKEQRPFKIDELATVFQQATGVDVGDILQHWLESPEY
jgi:predicted metalloprotease with PDZ domain